MDRLRDLLQLVIDDLGFLKSRVRDANVTRLTDDVPKGVRGIDPQFSRELETLVQRIVGLIEQVEQLVVELREVSTSGEHREQIRDTGFAAQTILAVIEDHLEWLGNQIAIVEGTTTVSQTSLHSSRTPPAVGPTPGPAPGPLSTLRAWAQSLWAFTKRISRSLWHIISGLLTPKEWTLSGEFGTGPFGLAKAGIEVKFGP
jgi:hypothetical protein